MNWRQNPTRIAWVILLTSFLLCCVLAVAVPLGTRSFLLHATDSRGGSIEATAGTLQMWTPGATDPRAVTARRPATEGSRFATDSTAKGLLTLATDETVISTVQLSPDTTIVLDRTRMPRFGVSEDPYQAVVSFLSGRVFIATQRPDGRDIRIRVITPQATISLGVGTFDLMIEGEGTQVRVRSGTAGILAQGQEVTAGAGQRVQVVAGRPPALPVPDTVNLVLNGSFESALEPLWDIVTEVKPGSEPGQVSLVQEQRRRAARFARRTEDGVPNTIGIQQVVNRDVEGYDSLALELDLKVLYQSVPGGGQLATEYPVMVDLFYTDIYGKDLHWYQGFFTPYQVLPPNYLSPTGESVPLGVWYTFESPNLFELLKETRPSHINWLRIYANGHDYESLVSNVALTVR